MSGEGPADDRTSRVMSGAFAAGCLCVTAVLAILVRATNVQPDRWLHRYVMQHRGSDLDVVRTLTQGGSTRIIWPVLVVAALVFPTTRGWRRPISTIAFFAGTAAGIGVRLELSRLVRRPRPPITDWAGTAGGWSFPSGHTMAATLGAGAMAWAIARHVARRQLRIAVWVLAALYAGTVGWTRVWLGVHWPLDVVGSWFLGVGWLVALGVAVLPLERRLGRSSKASTARADHVEQ